MSLGKTIYTHSTSVKSVNWYRQTLGQPDRSLCMSQVAHQAEASSGFSSMKQLRVFPLPPGWDASPSQGYRQH